MKRFPILPALGLAGLLVLSAAAEDKPKDDAKAPQGAWSRSTGEWTLRFTFRKGDKLTVQMKNAAGDGFTWSGMVGVEFRPRPWAGLVAGYKAFGIDVGSDDDERVREYDVTHYGPIVGLNLHFGTK